MNSSNATVTAAPTHPPLLHGLPAEIGERHLEPGPCTRELLRAAGL
ncbi:hypothetical protein [Streptomyces lavendulae]